MIKHKRTILITSAAAISLIGGLQFSVMKYALNEIKSPVLFLWVRFFVAFISAFVYAKVKKIRSGRDKNVIFLSLMHPLLAFYLQSLATASSDVTVVSVITALFPAISTLMAFMSGVEKLSPKAWFAVTGIVSGGIIAAVFGRKAGDFFTAGAAFMLCAIILRGIYYVMGHKITKGISPYELSYSQITYAFMGYSIMALLSGEFSLSAFSSLSGMGIISVLYMGILATTAAYFMNNYLLSNIPVSLNGSLSALTFVINLFAAHFINGEELSLPMIVGSGIIIISIVILGKEKGLHNS